jgi:membrane carboxypeptidase/penicillin-binding protein PbpC
LLEATALADTRGANDDPSPRDSGGAREALHIVNPPAGATYLRDPTLRDAFQTLSLRAVSSGRSRLAWEVDGRAVGRAAPEAALPWPLTAGRHVVSVEDEHGRRDEAEIVVK